MNSLIIGIARTGKPNNSVLNDETRYISTCGNKPEVTFSIDCGQDQFIRVINGLRYNDADPDSSSEAIAFFEDLATQLFKNLRYLEIDENDPAPLHIRLVTTPFELAQIPFEFALTPPNISGDQRIPLLANPQRKITLTREVRQESEAKYIWPSKPRILFAWAQQVPNLAVPHEEHLAILESIVFPLAKPDKSAAGLKPNIAELLTELPDATIESLRKKIKEGIDENRPYTHVHILAHGGEKDVFGVTEFCILLGVEGEENKIKKIGGKTLSEAIVPSNQPIVPTVVSLSVCDSGHVGNTILPSGSLVYQLHNNGIPCVFASQFPLTKTGSIKLTKTLYFELINACDPRIALYKTRIALKEDQHHDWASLVAYARFPDDINQQIQDAQLKMAFVLMQTTNSWVDRFLNIEDPAESEQADISFLDLKPRIDKSIEQLLVFLSEDKTKSTLLTEELRAEHLGLLGSAYKRKAEYLFRLVNFNAELKDELILQSREALKLAMDFYKFGFDANSESHWNAMQFLSLKAAITGSIKEEDDIWTIIKFMANRDMKSAKGTQNELWAWGTFAELYLVKPLMVQDVHFNTEMTEALKMAKECIDKIKVPGSKDVIDSTSKQIERYISWWPVMYPATFRKELKEMAIELKTYLLKPAETTTGTPG